LSDAACAAGIMPLSPVFNTRHPQYNRIRIRQLAPYRDGNNNMKKATICFLFLWFYLLFNALSTYADSVTPPFSYATQSEDGKYVFVMIAPVEINQDGIYGGNEIEQLAQSVRKKYTLSGLYQNDGSTKPLWTVGWYAYSVLISSDGIHLVRRGPWASSGDDEAVTFFANGIEIKSYKVNDLVDFIWLLPHTVSHFWWGESSKLDDHNKTLSITTLLKDKYVFDLTTGRIVSTWMPIRLAISSGVFSFFLLILLIRRKRMKAKRKLSNEPMLIKNDESAGLK